MRHLGTRPLESGRLLLRPMDVGDRDAMYRNWASDPAVTRYLTWSAHAAPSVTEAVLRDWSSQYGRPDYYQWGIVLKSLGEPVGSISVVHMDHAQETATLGWCIGQRWWRQGIASEALALVLDELIGQVGCRRVEAYHHVDNPNSGAVMRKCGMRLEGTLRQAARTNQSDFCDVRIYAIQAQDWRQNHGKGGNRKSTHD